MATVERKPQMLARRRFAMGTEVLPGEGTSFRVWAPDHRRVLLVPEKSRGKPLQMVPEAGGYFHLLCREAPAGTRYRFQLENDESYADPASRYQPQGPFGPSEVVDALAYKWTDNDWPGISLPGQVIYEMHIGTFTPAGTWVAATAELAELAQIGITVVEIMPVADFAGEFGWSYDGVNFFAPTRNYGTPDEMRCFVAEAHRVGIGVILDVVYNHVGPCGNFLGKFAADYTFAATALNGATRSTSTVRTRPRCEILLPRMLVTGSKSSTSTVCGLMPRRRCMTIRPNIS